MDGEGPDSPLPIATIKRFVYPFSALDHVPAASVVHIMQLIDFVRYENKMSPCPAP